MPSTWVSQSATRRMQFPMSPTIRLSKSGQSILPQNLTKANSKLSFFHRKNLFMKEKLNKKKHKLYTLFTIYTSDIVG